MSINSISFKGIYSIKKTAINSTQYVKLLNKKYSYGMEIESGSDLSNNFDKWYITVPDKNDNKLQKLFNRLKVRFKKINEEDAFNIDKIYSRISQENVDNYIFETVDTSELDKELQTEEGYVGKNGAGGSKEKYDKFKKFLRTQQAIVPPKISIEEQDGRVFPQINDGRHRFAVLRDLGIRNMPVLIKKNS